MEPALTPFEHYAKMRLAQPLKGIGDSLHTIHAGTQFEAELTFSHIQALLAALATPSASQGTPPMRDFWLHYDHQIGEWCVENEPPTVIRTGSEIIHTREVSATPKPIKGLVEWLREQEAACRRPSETIRNSHGEPFPGRADKYAEIVAALTALAAEVERLAGEIERLRAALEPLALLELPKNPQGNAGLYSIFHKQILAARAALETKP